MCSLIRLSSLTAIFALLSITTVYAQYCEPDYPPSTPNERFEVVGDGTVKDKQTGLIWRRCLEGLSGDDCSQGDAFAGNWEQALEQAEANLGWRVPNIKELHSIVEQQCFDPALNLQIFPGNNNTSYVWSSSPSSVDDLAWFVWFKVGRASSDDRESFFNVRLVRSAPSNSLQNYDLKTNGQIACYNCITYDSNTNLEYISLKLTKGLSYNQVSTNMLSAGGTFESFRYATKEEVITLFIHGGVEGFGKWVNPVTDKVISLGNSLGSTFNTQSDSPYLQGIYENPAGVDIREVAILQVMGSFGYLANTSYSQMSIDESETFIGSFLVREK